jgi:hypothetical protein
MTLEENITALKSQYDVLAVISLDPWHDLSEYNKKPWLRQIISLVHQEVYLDNQRIVFTITKGDVYENTESQAGKLITQLQSRLNEIDISNFFVIVLTNDVTIREAYTSHYQEFSKDPVPLTIGVYANEIKERRIQDKMSKKAGSYQYTNLDTLANQIRIGTETVPSAKAYNNPEYKLTGDDKLKSGGFGELF